MRATPALRSGVLNMGCRTQLVDNRGFALLIVFIIMSAVTIGLVILTSNAFKGENSSKNEVTVARMSAVAQALGQYYLTHRDLPVAGPDFRVPVGQLSLATKYRFDGWGKFLHYNYASALRRVSINGRLVAVALVSGGPDQEIELRPGLVPEQYILMLAMMISLSR